MKIGFTGSRKGLTEAQADELSLLLTKMDLDEFHHGDCIGSDEEALSLAQWLGNPWTVCHPPKDSKHRAHTKNSAMREPRPYLERNHDIVDETDMLIACPGKLTDELRSGTWATIRHAGRMGKPVIIIWPDGSIKKERMNP